MSLNRVILASAGAGKTTTVIKEICNIEKESVLITTFTDENTDNIRKKFYEINGSVPSNVVILPWFTFLLKDWVRPYQSVKHKTRISKMILPKGKSTIYVKKNSKKYYLPDNETIFSDKMVEFGFFINKITEGLVLERLNKLYKYIYIDEIQDLAGYDLSLIETLLAKGQILTLIGDLRQATFSTNMSSKNKKYKGYNAISLFERWKSLGLCDLVYMNNSYRCTQLICDFSDSLFPKGLFDKTEALSKYFVSHQGVYIVKESFFSEYINMFHPKILRYSIRHTKNMDNEMNFGKSKGLTFDRVLILPTKPILDYIKSEKNVLTDKNTSLLYVAITRARYSVAFIVPNNFRSCSEYLVEYRGDNYDTN